MRTEWVSGDERERPTSHQTGKAHHAGHHLFPHRLDGRELDVPRTQQRQALPPLAWVATTRLVQGSQLPALPVGGRMGCAVKINATYQMVRIGFWKPHRLWCPLCEDFVHRSWKRGDIPQMYKLVMTHVSKAHSYLSDHSITNYCQYEKTVMVPLTRAVFIDD